MQRCPWSTVEVPLAPDIVRRRNRHVSGEGVQGGFWDLVTLCVAATEFGSFVEIGPTVISPFEHIVAASGLCSAVMCSLVI